MTEFSITTLYPKNYFDPLAELNDRIKGPIITGDVTKHMGVMITKFDKKLEEVKLDDAKSQDGLKNLLKYLGTLRLSALCLAEIVRSDIVPKIDKLIVKIQFDKIAVYILILAAFTKQTPEEIAEILDD
jgi:hypothetical protein